MAKPYPVPVVIDEVQELILQGTLADGGGGVKNCFNVFYYRKTLNNNPTVKANLVAAFTATVIAPLLTASNVRYKPNSAKVRNVQNVADVPATIVIAGVGAVATDSEPSDDAIVVKLTSATRGKMCRGFKHFGGTSEVDTVQDLLHLNPGSGVATWGPVRDALKQVLVDANGNGWTPFILSRSFSSLVPPVKINGVNVLDAVLLRTIGTMRKRRTRTVYA